MQDDALEALTRFVGRWRGTVRTWLDPAGPPVENDITGSFRSILEGPALLHEYSSRVGDKRADGIAIIGQDVATNGLSLSWIDTFHTGSHVMLFAAAADGAAKAGMAMMGSYAAGEETWRWRVTHHMANADEVRIDHVNIAPDGSEYRAIEVVYRRDDE